MDVGRRVPLFRVVQNMLEFVCTSAVDFNSFRRWPSYMFIVLSP